MDITNTTLCITGYNGYIGSHLVRDLISRNMRPFLIGRPGVQLPEIHGAIMSKPWTDPSDLAEQLSMFKNSVTINLAGHFVKDHSTRDLTDMLTGNLTYPVQIFEAIALCGGGRLVNIGTSWEYTDVGIPEALNLYAALKKSNASVLEWYASKHSIRAINLKLNDTYGGEDGRPKLMPLLKHHYMTGEPAQLGYSSQLLNLTYITDVIRAILWACQLTADQQPGNVEEAFVFGSETASLGEIVTMLQEITDNKLMVRFRGSLPEKQRLRGIWSSAPNLRDWQPETNLFMGLKTYFGA